MSLGLRGAVEIMVEYGLGDLIPAGISLMTGWPNFSKGTILVYSTIVFGADGGNDNNWNLT